jgi:serine/threonine protein phosphatase PrpC
VVSSFVKSQLPNMVAKQLKQKGEAAAGAALRAAFLQTQEALRTTPAINSRLSGSTAVVVLLQGRRVTTAWVGDSRAMLVRRQSLHSACQGIQLTQDHKPSSTAELSRILACGGRVERLSDAMGREVGPQRVWLPGSWVPGLAMSRALGDFVAHSVGVTADADVTVTELSDKDEWLVVASDGVWEFISIQEAAEVVGGCGGAEEACRKLVEQAASRWEKANEGLVDDISVAIARFMPK